MDKSNRIINLDFLRGIFLIFALDEHFTYYVNMWFVEYFRDSIALDSTYSYYSTMIGKQIPTDAFNYILGISFIPWVSHVYLTLACFNLAKRTKLEFKDILNNKLKIFGMIFVFFVLENFIVAPDTGQALSIYPIMMWMVIMSLIAVLYRYFGVKAIVLLSIISLFRFFMNNSHIGDSIQLWGENNIHPSFEYDARLEYFLTSGCVGFLLGFVHYHIDQLKKVKDYFGVIIGFILFMVWYVYGEPVVLIHTNAFAREHDWAVSPSGYCMIIGLQVLVISLFLKLEQMNITFNWPIINWVGINSILVFALHRVLFVKLIAPISVLIGSMIGRTITAHWVEMYSYALITIGLCWLIKKYKLHRVAFKD